MTVVDILLDTNILIYAHDVDAGERHTKAARLVRGFWDRRELPAVSIQILQEMHVNLVRKGVPVADQLASRPRHTRESTETPFAGFTRFRNGCVSTIRL